MDGRSQHRQNTSLYLSLGFAAQCCGSTRPHIPVVIKGTLKLFNTAAFLQWTHSVWREVWDLKRKNTITLLEGEITRFILHCLPPLCKFPSSGPLLEFLLRHNMLSERPARKALNPTAVRSHMESHERFRICIIFRKVLNVKLIDVLFWHP